jgi:hypothetical protein
MAWRIYVVPADKRASVEELLTRDDLLWRQTRILRDAQTLGGVAGETYLYMEGSETAMTHADGAIPPLGVRAEGALAEKLHARFKEEEEMSAQGMGLMFSDEP